MANRQSGKSNGEVLCQCPHCPTMLSRKKLVDHIGSVHKQGLLRCPDCGALVASKNMRNHRRNPEKCKRAPRVAGVTKPEVQLVGAGT